MIERHESHKAPHLVTYVVSDDAGYTYKEMLEEPSLRTKALYHAMIKYIMTDIYEHVR